MPSRVETAQPPDGERQLKRRVRQYMNDLGEKCVGDVEIETYGPIVVLRGTVPTRHERWLCANRCRRVAGVIRVVDELTVADEPGS